MENCAARLNLPKTLKSSRKFLKVIFREYPDENNAANMIGTASPELAALKAFHFTENIFLYIYGAILKK